MAIIFIFFITNTGYCQSEVSNNIGDKSIVKDTVKRDSIVAFNDSLGKDSLSFGIKDTVRKDTVTNGADSTKMKRSKLENELGIKISKDALPSIVKAESRDSAVMDMQHNLFYLYGKAQVNYEDLQLNAGQVTYAQSTNVVSAAPYEADKVKGDTSTEKQTFQQGKEKFVYDSMQYNFKSHRAIVRNVHSQYGEGFVYSEQVKRNPDQTIYGWHSTYTTCALDTPHFGIVAKKIKVIPGKLIVSGPCNLYIEGVPTPLWLPFGLFPVSEKQKSGFVLPTYTIEEQRGLGLLNGGYYFYISDHVDLLTQANIYTKGSYAVSSICDYNTLYHYSGAFNFSYAYNKTGEDFEPNSSITKDFMLNWRHQSDAKSVPGQSFNASVQMGSSTYYSNNSLDPNQILQNQRQSNISYSKNWQGTPFGLTISALGDQNTLNKQTDVTLPDINFHVAQINPFQNKRRVGTHWTDKITASYNVDMLNRTTFYDSTLNIANLSLKNFQSGVHHSIPISASYTVLRYLNMSFSANYNEYWYDDNLHVKYDSATQKLDSVDKTGFFAARDFNAGVNFSTRIYGMKLFKKGSLRGIRHVLTPSIGFVYHPDFGVSPYNYYYRTTIDSTNNYKNYTYQSPYVTSIVGTPPLGKAANVNFGINNNLQIKVKSSKDTITGFKNVTLIDAFGVTATYNPAADSFQWSPIGVNFRTNVMDKVSITSTANFDPYTFDYDKGRDVPQLMESNGFGLARFTSATLGLGTNFHSKPKGGAADPGNSEEYGRVMRNAGYNDYVDFNIPWSLNISYSLNANKSYSYLRRDTMIYSQTLMFNGELQVTKRWKLNVTSGYNFEAKQLTSTSIDVYRDLHCWAMHLQTIPFGPRKSFTFTLNVKSTILQDLKLTKRRDYRDAPQ